MVTVIGKESQKRMKWEDLQRIKIKKKKKSSWEKSVHFVFSTSLKIGTY